MIEIGKGSKCMLLHGEKEGETNRHREILNIFMTNMAKLLYILKDFLFLTYTNVVVARS